MANIELVIKIPEEEYHNILLTGKASFCAVNAIEAGTIPPKGHGRLIDMKNLQKFVSRYTEYDAIQLILADREDYMPTIIEADTER